MKKNTPTDTIHLSLSTHLTYPMLPCHKHQRTTHIVFTARVRLRISHFGARIAKIGS